MIRRLPFLIIIILAVAIAIATFVEHSYGTQVAMRYIYTSPWFITLWGAVVAFSIPLIARRRMWRNIPALLLHTSFVIILAGALTTHIFGTKDSLHLRNGDTHNGLRLDSFSISYYPLSDTPQNYISHCTIQSEEGESKVQISMNRPLTYEGSRYYQSSYDPDLGGTILTVNHDPYGTNITYTGYALLAISVILILIKTKNKLRVESRELRVESGELRDHKQPLTTNLSTINPQPPTLNPHPSSFNHKPLWFIVLVCVCVSAILILCFFGSEQNQDSRNDSNGISCMSRVEADTLKYKQIIYNGRICPVSTLAHDFTTKLTGKPTFRGLTSEQVMFSWMLYADEWQYVDMIKVKDKELLRRLGIKTKYARFVDFFDENGNYRLTGPGHEDINEKLGLILWLNEGTLIKPLPKDATPLSDFRIKAEVFYNEVPATSILFMACLTMAIIALACSVITLNSLLSTLTSLATLLLTLFLLAFIILRWYISGTIPLTNGFETMQFIALVSLVIGCVSIFRSRNKIYIQGGAMLIAGFTLLVAHLSEMNPQITPLMPVLHSPWLSSHVSIIMISYALFAFMTINSIAYLIIKLRAKDRELRDHKPQPLTTNLSTHHSQLTTLNQQLLYPATLFLAVGIFLGAVWANQSWGTYWSWDPKESWALITMLTYGMAFHRQSLPWLRKERNYHIFIALAFLTILMTYFGVNYMLGGMHSYGGG